MTPTTVSFFVPPDKSVSRVDMESALVIAPSIASRCSALEKLASMHEHEHETLAGALTPFSLQGQYFPKHVLRHECHTAVFSRTIVSMSSVHF